MVTNSDPRKFQGYGSGNIESPNALNPEQNKDLENLYLTLPFHQELISSERPWKIFYSNAWRSPSVPSDSEDSEVGPPVAFQEAGDCAPIPQGTPVAKAKTIVERAAKAIRGHTERIRRRLKG